MKRNHYARKKRHLKVLVQKLKVLLNNHTNQFSDEVNTIVIKIKNLLQDLKGILSRFDAKKMLGAVTISLGLCYSGQVKAQLFQPPVLNPNGLVSMYNNSMPNFVDLDGDGDLDLLTGDFSSGLFYSENIGTGTNPAFGSPVLNPFGFSPDSSMSMFRPTTVDLDNDGDMDVVFGTHNGNISYAKNIGTPTNPIFDTIQTFQLGLAGVEIDASPAFADLDNDGDMDLLVGGYSGSFYYFENIGTPLIPDFSMPTLNPFGIDTVFYMASPTFADFDNDGDLDMLSGEMNNHLQYFENTGSNSNPVFATPLEDPFGLIPLSIGSWGWGLAYSSATTAADLDSDGDIDILTGGSDGNYQYFENTIATGIQSVFETDILNMYPNPVESILWIDVEEPMEQVEIFNVMGQSIQVIMKPTNQIDVESLQRGMYLVKVIMKSGKQTINKIQKL